MLSIVVRRAWDQRRALAAVVLLVTAATTLCGVCALLLGPTQDRAFRGGVHRLEPPDVDVTAYVVNLAVSDLASSRQDAEELVRGVLSDLDPTLTSIANSRMRRLAGDDGLAYLATGDDVEHRTHLVDGRWPDPAGPATGQVETAVPEAAAERLGLAVGDTVTVGGETGVGGADEPVTLSVVGVFRALGSWPGDTLSGAGFDPAYNDGSGAAPGYGPFVLGDAAFIATGSNVTGLQVTGDPDLAEADDARLRAAADAMDDGSARLSAQLGDRAEITRLASELPTTLERLHSQQATTRSTVLDVLLVAAALALGTLLLTGRVLAAVREEERAFLIALGLSPVQQLRAAATESLLVAVVSAGLAAPAAALVHSRLTRLPSMSAAGLTQGPAVTAGLVVTVIVGALALASALAGPALDRERTARTWTRGLAAASMAVDPLLIAVALAGWWQLHTRPATAANDDIVLTLAPVVCLAAACTVVVRRVRKVLSVIAHSGTRARSLVLPLALQQSARRPRATVALVLVATAVAAATFATGLQATWQRSQHDQADLRVGTDLALSLSAPATPSDAAAVAAAAPDSPASPVAGLAMPLGHYIGQPGEAPALVALDATQAGSLLRGRLDQGSWAAVGSDLAPDDAVTGIPVHAGDPVELEGLGPAQATVTVTPTVVVQDPTGLRTSFSARTVTLDGTRHRLRWRTPLVEGQVVALRLVMDSPGAPLGEGSTAPVPIVVTLRLPGGDGGEKWRLAPPDGQSPVEGGSIDVTSGPAETLLQTRAAVDLSYLAYTDAVLLGTSFAPPGEVPVAVSRQVTDVLGAGVDRRVSGTIGGVTVDMRVVAVVPDIPAAPGRAAVLADVDTLSRALIVDGRLDPVVNAWWVADPAPGTASALRSDHLGEVTTRSELTGELTRGPLRVTTPTALQLLVGAAVGLLLAGGGLLVGGDQRRRAAEATRLRALGLTRGETRRLLLAEHALLLAPLVVLGSLVGAAATWALAPALVRSDLGTAPVPDAVVVWPWLAEVLLVGGVLAGCLLISLAVATLQVRRSDPALLRTDET